MIMYAHHHFCFLLFRLICTAGLVSAHVFQNAAHGLQSNRRVHVAQHEMLESSTLTVDLCNVSLNQPIRFVLNDTNQVPVCNVSLSNSSHCKLNIYGTSSGRISIVVFLNRSSTVMLALIKLKVTDMQRTPIELAFIVGIVILLIVALFSLGCKLELKNLLRQFRRPCNIAIGLICQFILMPVIAFGLAQLSYMPSELMMALFACAISPGGGASNLYTEMFKGDVDLSVVMTFTSSMAAFVTVPLWLLTLGHIILPNVSTSDVVSAIPFSKITTSLLSLIVPLVSGVLLNRFKPKLGARIGRMVKVLSLIFLAYVIVMGFVAYYPIFYDIQWRPVVCSIILPWVGFILGSGIATAFGRSQEEITAICLETGIQNTGIAIFIIEQIFPQPARTRAIICPIFYALATPIPIIVCFSIRMILEKIRNKRLADGEIKEDQAEVVTGIPIVNILADDGDA